MSKKEVKRDTKTLLFEKGAELIYLKGYNSTGLQEILQAAGVPKGSFYFHFKSKEDYVLQLMDYFGDFMFAWLDKTLNEPDKSPLTRLRTFFQEFLAYYKGNGYKGGCPIGNLSQEMGDINDTIASKAETLLGGMKIRFIKTLLEAQHQDEISSSIDVETTADFIINSWQGAVTRTKILRSDAAMLLFEKTIFDNLLKS